jgi:hypothetical protein
MPSAQQVATEAPNVEGSSVNEQKASENAQQNDLNNGVGEKNSLPHINQALQIIQNKVRNLEKRKVMWLYKSLMRSHYAKAH